MSTFTLAISYLTTSNLPSFRDLTFQVPMQYCYLQHQTLILSPVPSTTRYCFCLGSIPSFFLELLLHWSPVAYLAPTVLGSSSFSFLSFCLLILFMGFSRQEYWSGLPFPSPADHTLSVFISTPKKGNPKECSNYHTFELISHASKVTLKILQARLKQYVNCELPEVQDGFRKGRGTRDQITNICWIIKKQDSSRKTSISALLTMPKPLTVWLTITVENSERDGNTRPPDLPLGKPACRSGSNR